MINFNVDVSGLLKKFKTDDLMNKLETNLGRSLSKVAMAAKTSIIVNNHVITGKLRDSHSYTLKRSGYVLEGETGSFDVFYAKYVERHDPFLFPAWESEKGNIIRQLKEVIF